MNDVKEGVKIELLRLGPPILNKNIWNLFEIDKLINIQNDNEKHEIDEIDETKEEGKNKKENGEEQISLSNEFSLNLPINNKKIYLGQNFKSYIIISNNFKSSIKIISINIDVLLQNKNSNFNIYKNTEQINVLPDSFFDFITEFHVLFLEIFTIRCIAEYYLDNEKRTVKKNFSFICKNPLHLKANIIPKNEKLFVEVLLKNIEEDGVMLNEIRLKDIKCEIVKSDELLYFTKGIHFFKQNDEFSLVFYITDENSKRKILKSLKGEKITDIEMKYFTMSGGAGINQFYELRLNTDIDIIKIYLKTSQETFYLRNKIYKLEFFFENNTDETIILDIYIHNSSNIHIVNNFVKSGYIEKKATSSYIFDVLFIKPGLYFFNKISIYNKTKKQKIEYRDLFKVCIR